MEQLSLFGTAEQLRLQIHLLKYHPGFFTKTESLHFLETFNTVAWKQSKVQMYEQEVLTPRMTAWYGDSKENKNPAAASYLGRVNWLPGMIRLRFRN